MRLVSTGNNPPREVDKYLLLHEREHQVITVRMHPAVLVAPVALALGGLIVAVVLNGSVLSGQRAIMMIVWVGWLILFLWALVKAATWSVEYFVVTSRRMILTSGLLTRKVAMMPLNKVTDMSFQRSPGGRLFGYGEFILESAGQDQALRNIPFIPYPEQLYLEVCDLLFPSKDDGDD
jgi:membrane protein YdbS with pleckstrin-like domain